MQESFDNQISRHLAARFPKSVMTAVLTAVAESLIQKTKATKRMAIVCDKLRPVVVPYLHRVTHQLKKVAGRHGVPVAFSVPNKLSKLMYKPEYKPRFFQ